MKHPKGWLSTKDVSRLSPSLTPDDVIVACRKGTLYHRKVGRLYQIPIKSALAFATRYEIAHA